MDTEHTDLQKHLQRDINCLTEEDRNLRLKGLNNIKDGLFKPENSQADIQSVFEKGLLKNILLVTTDKVGKHRDLALQIIQKFFERVNPIEDDIVSSIVRALTTRLNTKPYPEESEEIRLNILKLFRKIFGLGYTKAFSWNLAEFSFMLSKALLDEYPEAKKEACSLIVDLSHGLKDTIGEHSSSIFKSLSENLTHQQSKVRKPTIESIGELLLTREAGKHLRELIFRFKNAINDKTSDVRKASYQVIARLLNGFSPSLLKEYESELVQMLLNGLGDDNEDVRNLCEELLENVGENMKKLEENIQVNGPEQIEVEKK